MKGTCLRTFLCAAVFVTSLAGCATHEPISDLKNTKPEFVLYPGLHNLFLDPSWQLTLPDLIASLRSDRLDTICVEITKEDFDNKFEGLYPPEAAAISEVFGNTIVVIPADWRASHELYKKITPATEKIVDTLNTEFRKDLEQSKNKVYFSLSANGETEIQKVHDTIVDRDGEAADGFWVTRNQKISENCIQGALAHGSRKVGMVFGVDHLYTLKRNIARSGFKISTANLVRTSSEDKISKAVISRWQRNLAALIDAKSSPDLKGSFIESSGRTKDLRSFIRTYDM